MIDSSHYLDTPWISTAKVNFCPPISPYAMHPLHWPFVKSQWDFKILNREGIAKCCWFQSKVFVSLSSLRLGDRAQLPGGG